jgi:hypothetical protein
MSFRKKNKSLTTREVDGKVVLEIKSCSGSRNMGRGNPHDLPSYTNLSMSGSVPMGEDFENYMVNMALSYGPLIKGTVFVFKGQFYEMETGDIKAMGDFIESRSIIKE